MTSAYQTYRHRLHRAGNEKDKVAPGPFSNITTRDQLKKYLKDHREIPWGDVPDHIRNLLNTDENGVITDKDFCVNRGYLHLRK